MKDGGTWRIYLIKIMFKKKVNKNQVNEVPL